MLERRQLKNLLAGILLLLAAAPALPQAKPVRDPALLDLQGYRQLLEKHRGKPLLVNFWATWCEPCRAEFPLLGELAREYAPQGLRVVGVSMDGDGDMILVRRFLARHKPVFPNYRKRPGHHEPFELAISPQWQGALPTTLLYSPDGTLVRQITGGADRATYEAAIRALLAASSPGAPPKAQ
ncbi:MAG: TlpA family protein disulfide reductase [Acidobacteriia bacterium]|nr:TlpA family protein disulfide reductase [Terriglobia bacterium]